jgi:hypothetical protein
MSSPTRHQRRREQRDARRAAAAATAQAEVDRDAHRTQLRRRVRRAALVTASLALLALTEVLAAVLSQTVNLIVTLLAALVAGSIIAGFALHHRFAPKLGRFTTVFALALATAAIFAALAYAAPHCPDNGAGAPRCSAGQDANWALVGLLVPIVYGLLFGAPLLFARSGFRLTVKALRTLRARWHDTVNEAADVPSDQNAGTASGAGKRPGPRRPVTGVRGRTH